MSFLELANEVVNQMAGKPQAVDWLVSVEAGSVRVHMVPEPRHLEPAKTIEAIQVIQTGLHALETGVEEWPAFFTDKALEAARDLALVLSRSEGELTKIKVGYNGRSESLSSRSIATVDALLKGQYTDYGTLEGRVQVISKRRSFRFSIDEDVTGRAINCYFPKEMFEEVLGSFAQEERVSISGMIAYRRDGKPVNITVEEFRLLRPKKDLPTFEDMLGILK